MLNISNMFGFPSIQLVAALARMPYWCLRLILSASYAITVLGSLSITVGILCWPLELAASWHQISEAAKAPWIRIAATVICVLIGTLLYFARTYMRPVYAAAEILFGAAACWAALGNASSDVVAGTVPLAAGLYIIVRGIDNWNAPQKAPEAPAPTKA